MTWIELEQAKKEMFANFERRIHEVCDISEILKNPNQQFFTQKLQRKLDCGIKMCTSPNGFDIYGGYDFQELATKKSYEIVRNGWAVINTNIEDVKLPFKIISANATKSGTVEPCEDAYAGEVVIDARRGSIKKDSWENFDEVVKLLYLQETNCEIAENHKLVDLYGSKLNSRNEYERVVADVFRTANPLWRNELIDRESGIIESKIKDFVFSSWEDYESFVTLIRMYHNKFFIENSNFENEDLKQTIKPYETFGFDYNKVIELSQSSIMSFERKLMTELGKINYKAHTEYDVVIRGFISPVNFMIFLEKSDAEERNLSVKNNFLNSIFSFLYKRLSVTNKK